MNKQHLDQVYDFFLATALCTVPFNDPPPFKQECCPRAPNMKPVIQLERTGCGIASVAALAGLSYPRAKSIAHALGISAQDRSLWSETAHVRKLLGHLDIKTSRREVPFRSWTALPDRALLAIKWHLEQGRPYWHWVVFVRDGGRAYVLDSKPHLRRHRRTDFGRMRPKWYIPVVIAADGRPG